MAHDVFISYSTKDKTVADAVCARLEVRGIRCWIAPRDVQPGFPYAEEIIDAIHSCSVMVLVLSSNANASNQIPKEIERAVSRGIPVIPLRIEDVLPGKSLDYFISSVHWLDAITPPLEEHVDSLAKTIRTLLPKGVPPPTPQPEPAPLPIPAIPVAVAAASGRRKPNWLLPGIGIGVAALAAGGWFLWGRAPDPQPANPPVIVQTNPPPSPNVKPTSPRQPRAFSSPATLAEDPVVGCWRWFNNASVVISPNGGVTAGQIYGHWRAADSAHRAYTINWPEAVDSVAMSPDGSTLGGGNQYGIVMSASRQSFGPGIAGSWRWYNGVIVTIREDGTFTAAHLSGRWQMTGPGTFNLTWPGPVDTLTLSPDQQRLNGSNQYGFHISGTKTGAC